MGIRTLKPITPGTRRYSVNSFEEITTDKPYKALTTSLKRNSGRNNTGRITSRHKGGRHKRRLRIIDWQRNKIGMKAKVDSIEYDPNRSAFIALVTYKDGEKRYILAPDKIQVGEEIESGPNAELKVGNALPLEKIPAGFIIHNLEMKPGKGGQLVRSAGQEAQLVGFDDKNAQVKLPSGESRFINKKCFATIGRVSNSDHENIILGKAGRNRWKGVKPQTRGMAMNPVDHPMGGGEGASKSGGGRQHPRSPWGLYAKGKKTRKLKNKSNKMIIRKRKTKKQGK